MVLSTIKIPIVPQWNMVSGCVATPDEGFLYVGLKTINYISQIQNNDTPPIIKLFHTRQPIRALDCDSDWSKTKYFAILADDNSVQVWDFEEERAVRGHKAHFKQPQTEGDNQYICEDVHMSFTANRNILSMNSTDLVIYCVLSNTYTRRPPIIPKKYKMTCLRCSPYNPHIFAAGTINGVVLLADLITKNIIYTLRGHDSSITCLAWNRLDESYFQSNKSSVSKEKEGKVEQTFSKAQDDIFDIYDYDYLENEFGNPVDTPHNQRQIDEAEKGLKEQATCSEFDFIEECKSLKEQIAAMKKSADSPAVEVEDTANYNYEIKQHTNSSSPNESINSLEFVGKNSTDGSMNVDPIVVQHQVDVHTPKDSEKVEGNESIQETTSSVSKWIVLLASASSDGCIWTWDTESGGPCAEFKDRATTPGKNKHIEVAWLNNIILAGTSRSGNVTCYTLDKTRPYKFKEAKKVYPEKAVVSICRSKTAPVLWTISSYREIRCKNLETGKIIASFGCASTNVLAMRERPDDMNKIALAFTDRRIGILDISKISPTHISIENFVHKIDTQVTSLVWSPDSGALAFGTNQGRVGILQVDNIKIPPFLFHPICGKPIYSIDWKNKCLYVCCNEKVAIYMVDKKTKSPIILECMSGASTVSVHGEYIFVGTQHGHVDIFKEKGPEWHWGHALIRRIEVGHQYISDISWNPINPSRFFASVGGKIRVYNFNDSNGSTSLYRDVSHSMHFSCVNWSTHRENMLVASGFDGSIRVWDLNKQNDEEVFIQHFSGPMFSAIFLPTDENIIMCSGKTTSIEMCNMSTDLLEKKVQTNKGRKNPKSLESVQWGTRLNDVDCAKAQNRLKKSNKEQEHNSEDIEVCSVAQTVEHLATSIEAFNLNQEKKPTPPECESCQFPFLQCPPSILSRTRKEINKCDFPKLHKILVSPEYNHNKFIFKLFGSQADLKELLREELKCRKDNIPLMVIGSNLKEDIIKRIEAKQLTEWHVSLAPTISYTFWKKCCIAFANQLLDKGYVLQSATYLMAIHDIKGTIEILLDKKFFKEALIIAKMYCQPDAEIINEITDKWVKDHSSCGGYIAAAYICIASGQFEKALNELRKIRNNTPTEDSVIEELQKLTRK